MIVEKLSSSIDIKRYLKELNVDGGGVSILASKAKVHIIRIKNLNVGGANILKQDALSIGADLAVPRGTVLAKTPFVDTLLIATTSQLKTLARKELAQPFGLKELAHKLGEFVKDLKPSKIDVMGIINANDDSFFSGSRFVNNDALHKIERMIEEGATIIDIGGVSSRPNADSVSARQELQRVKPIIDLIKVKKLYDKVKFSIDSYEPSVIEYALSSGFSIVNDITGLQNDEVCELCAKHKATVIIMHMQGGPQSMQDNPFYKDVLSEVYTFLQERIKKAQSFGIDGIVVDVGIGFGKRLEDNLSLIKNLEHFTTLGKPILIGASRKSMINSIIEAEVEDRLSGTLAIHLEALRNGASIVRVHDVKEHVQALKVQNALDMV
ncbi:dihydropteroate synthase [Sulfurimonas sp.]|jgi:dihydropteroate synthase|uniref:dihydropteroate synthase n=1 Tax=Sulfurimonas sp. TaxID=2022749 RepID=UPI0025F6591E|nr:dihydropteroate synthase [Sulfurimonas sp.]MBT5933896.1 dihydropteroate synthase [Sulfurimonas sp.]